MKSAVKESDCQVLLDLLIVVGIGINIERVLKWELRSELF